MVLKCNVPCTFEKLTSPERASTIVYKAYEIQDIDKVIV